ncbi:MAG: hypothetical protein R2794_11740 [Chitinophagales bacterium]
MERTKCISLLALWISGVFNFSCKNAEPKAGRETNEKSTFDMELAKVAILDVTEGFTHAHLTKDTAFLNNCFAEDAKVFPPSTALVRGKRPSPD